MYLQNIKRKGGGFNPNPPPCVRPCSTQIFYQRHSKKTCVEPKQKCKYNCLQKCWKSSLLPKLWGPSESGALGLSLFILMVNPRLSVAICCNTTQFFTKIVHFYIFVCMGIGKIFSRGVTSRFFQVFLRGPKVVKFVFYHSKTKKTAFFAEIFKFVALSGTHACV